jgi:hypothetical protein
MQQLEHVEEILVGATLHIVIRRHIVKILRLLSEFTRCDEPAPKDGRGSIARMALGIAVGNLLKNRRELKRLLEHSRLGVCTGRA